jgi:hypothetical protein
MVRLMGIPLILVAVIIWFVIPEESKQRPRSEITVLVLDDTLVENAGLSLSNTMRGLGYLIMTPAEGGGLFGFWGATTVQCRAGYEREQARLAEDVGFGAREARSPLPPNVNPDCIVVLRSWP